MTKIPVDSIEIPERYLRLCEGWHGGQDCTLYAILSTGGLTLGTFHTFFLTSCTDYIDDEDRDRKWYYVLWCDLACDVGRARKAACLANHADCDALLEFEEWVNDQVSQLCMSYRLEDWSW